MNGALSRPCLAAAAGLLTRESVPPPDRIFVAGRPAFDREKLIHYGIHKQKKLTIEHSQRSLLVSSALWFTAKGKPGRAGRQGSVQRGGRPGQPGDALRSNKCSAHTLTARRCRPFACLFGGKRHPYVTLCPCRITPTPHIACWTPSSLCCFVALFHEAPRKVLVEEPNCTQPCLAPGCCVYLSVASSFIGGDQRNLTLCSAWLVAGAGVRGPGWGHGEDISSLCSALVRLW